MLSVKVEKEIKQENRVIGPLTLRQTVCLIAALIGVILFAVIVRPDLETGMGAGLILGAIAWFFGFYKKNGIYIEYFIIKRVKIFCFRNFQRKYRTKNRYIRLMNDHYEKERTADLSDKKRARKVKRMEKKRRAKREHMRAYL